MNVLTRTVRCLDEDLVKANTPKNTSERKIDFHSLRTTYITLLLENGANPKEAQELARHSTLSLTMNTYARTRQQRLHDITETAAETIGLQ
ncbi:MAG: tyrosine-type recombinase/integrase [Planctomycetes bacterium]|nr:tyrosine-type recombinase/integrase [Planctomycetota bacterium]